jgi:hypothetical protein
MSSTITNCRLCKSTNLEQILNLGNFYYTGIFPKNINEEIPQDAMSVIKCKDCDLAQLEQKYNLSILYGNSYGYRSGLNKSMVEHLTNITNKCQKIVHMNTNDTVLDIGSNDGTLLNSYTLKGINKWGIDPLSKKFKKYYNSDINTVPNFFDKNTYLANVGNKKAKIVTSIAMFYDLDDPLHFAENIRDILDDNGIWLTEQSYLPFMINTNSYDTICQEHLEYYCLKQLVYIANKIDLKIIDVEFNNINGGSFQVILAHKDSKFNECTSKISEVLLNEERDKYNTSIPFTNLRDNMISQKDTLLEFLNTAKTNGEKVYGYGASTKGNVLLQYCGITADILPKIAEVNEEKFGSYTPGTLIPIVDEKIARSEKPDYFLVLPWHFKDNIVKKEEAYLKSGGKLIFPLPKFNIVSNNI